MRGGDAVGEQKLDATDAKTDLEHLQGHRDLWIAYKYRDSEQAREQLIEQYVDLVKYVAGQLAVGMPEGIQPSELETYGVFGLIDALERFDIERGIKFETYAVTRIRGSILDGVRKMDWVPASVRRKKRRIEKAYRKLREELGRPATDEEVAEQLGITLKRFRADVEQISRSSLVYLDESPTDDVTGAGSLLNFIPDDNAANPFDEVSWKMQKQRLAEAIEQLSEREQLVLTLYYYEGLTLSEIGEVLDLSASRISQIHSKAVMRLRGMLSREKQLFES